jgi:hypothetical protein
MREIPLTNSPLVALVDDEDYERVSAHKWFLVKDEGRVKMTNSGSRYAASPRLHHFIMGKAPKGFEWDHRFGDQLDNRKENLRLATHAQNLFNCKRRVDNTSGYRGVAWDKTNGNWMSYINAHGQRYNLGRFSDPISAAKARDEAAKELHGDFHRTNLTSPHGLSTEVTRVHTKRLRRIDDGGQKCRE